LNQLDLIYKCKKNNRQAQSELYLLYKDRLYVLCLKYCKNTKDAEDVLQDSFVTIFTKISKYNATGSFEGWLKRITINKAIDKYHEKKVKHLPLIEEITENIVIEDNLTDFSLDFILQLVQELPNRYRMVFNLYELDDYSHKEIADLLKISIGTSKSNLHRAKLILKEKLTQNKNTIKNYG
jgi:RNA polymerase sigma-70 factor (ECF subfamily)